MIKISPHQYIMWMTLKFVILGSGNELYVSHQMDSKIVIDFLEIISDEIKIIFFDP